MNASSFGAETVNGPALARVPASPAASMAATSIVRSSRLAATTTTSPLAAAISSSLMSSDISSSDIRRRLVSDISSSAISSSDVVVSAIARSSRSSGPPRIASVVAGLDAASFDELSSLPHAARASAPTMARAAGVRVRIGIPPCEVAPGVGRCRTVGTVARSVDLGRKCFSTGSHPFRTQFLAVSDRTHRGGGEERIRFGCVRLNGRTPS